MEFRLIYKSPLPAEGRQSDRARQKQLLRKEFHKQLKELWKQHPDLRARAESYDDPILPAGRIRFAGRGPIPQPQMLAREKSWIERTADNHKKFGCRFVPLVSKAEGFTCSLVILFLRREAPGSLIVHGASGGDIDSRIKILFDSLKMPETVNDLGGLAFEKEEDPFYCLLEDASLVTQVSITTDRLLTPPENGETRADVHVIIHVIVTNPALVFTDG